jgi:hypothetical protein
MPTISDLYRMGCSLRSPFGIFAPPIAADDFHAWVLPQPFSERFCGAFRQQIHDAMSFEIA